MRAKLLSVVAMALICAPCSTSTLDGGQLESKVVQRNVIRTAVPVVRQSVVIQPQVVEVPVTVQTQRVEMVDVQKQVTKMVPVTETITVQEPRIVTEEQVITKQMTVGECLDCSTCTCVDCDCSVSAEVQVFDSDIGVSQQAVGVQKSRTVNRTRILRRPRVLLRTREVPLRRVPTLGVEGNASLQSRAQAAANALARNRTTSHAVTRRWRPSNVFEGTGYASGGRTPPTCVPWEYGSSKRNLVADAVAYDGGGRAYRVRWWS